ncbi:hypothetical protein [Rubrivivax gelatinosus]|uniref:hypothetical protein n=1 Tax=Rubrivivax gelatinosus TaxID=28068 RepID=UPI0012FDB51C|nr:hypothetical protein [Rubrivivax gelatinosus]
MKPHSWLPLFGSVNVEENSITLVPVPPPPTTPAAPPTTPLALVRSNVDFEQGDVEFDVFLPTSDSACQVVLNSGTHSELFAGLNVFAAPYGFAAFANAKWEPLQTTGQGSALKAPAKYKLRVSVQGSSVDLSVNGVKVATVTHQVVRAPLGILLQSSGAVSVSNFQIKAQQSTAFVVMQFTDEYNSLFKDVIKPTCEEYRYKVIRADDFYTSGLILNDITRSIRDSTLVIADVTPDNANVFYELGTLTALESQRSC